MAARQQRPWFKCVIAAVVSVSEDYSRKTRAARDQLRRFGRDIRRGNPEKKVQMR